MEIHGRTRRTGSRASGKVSGLPCTTGPGLLIGAPASFVPNCRERPSEKPHERASRLAIRRLIAT